MPPRAFYKLAGHLPELFHRFEASQKYYWFPYPFDDFKLYCKSKQLKEGFANRFFARILRCRGFEILTYVYYVAVSKPLASRIQPKLLFFQSLLKADL